jgi:MOSC domain-containing protein YiiM
MTSASSGLAPPTGRVADLALKQARRGPMRRLERVVLHKNFGLDGLVTRSGRRQVTLIESEKWLDVQRELRCELPWYERRANVLTAGIALAELVGRRVRLGTAILEVLGELEPCARMHEIHPGLYDALVPDFRGGVYARILENGAVALADAIVPLHEPLPASPPEAQEDSSHG